MKIVARIFGTTLGRKYIMAISGVVMCLFVTGHMIGNLQLFLGPEALNRYAHFLQSNVELLWPVRLILLAVIGLHVWSALSLSVENNAARPVDYGHGKTPFGASLASRTMLGSGGIIALFIVYHLLHYTVCAQAVNFAGIDFAHLEDPQTGYHDVFAMVVYGFNVWYVSLFYIIAVGLLSLHLSHGGSAMFQSLGLRNHTWWPVISKATIIWAVILFLGYAAVPGSVLAGYGKSYLEKVKIAPAALSTSAVTEAATNAVTAAEEAK